MQTFYLFDCYILFTADMPINIMDLYDHTKQVICSKIGFLWPELARALQFDDTDIDAIKVGPDRENLNGQIFKMIQQWEQRHDSGKGTVYKLLCGLHTAVNSTGDARLKEIRDRIFTDVVRGKYPIPIIAILGISVYWLSAFRFTII